VNGVERFFARLDERGGDVRRLGAARIAAIGPETARALRRRHLHADLVPPNYRAEDLLDAFAGNRSTAAACFCRAPPVHGRSCRSSSATAVRSSTRW
jgi:uroporphyrinogen-III synthase